jgi:hypothetical protein
VWHADSTHAALRFHAGSPPQSEKAPLFILSTRRSAEKQRFLKPTNTNHVLLWGGTVFDGVTGTALGRCWVNVQHTPMGL